MKFQNISHCFSFWTETFPLKRQVSLYRATRVWKFSDATSSPAEALPRCRGDFWQRGDSHAHAGENGRMQTGHVLTFDEGAKSVAPALVRMPSQSSAYREMKDLRSIV